MLSAVVSLVTSYLLIRTVLFHNQSIKTHFYSVICRERIRGA